MTDDERQALADKMIREIVAEIDATTIKRWKMGQRLVPDGRGGHCWTYFVDAQGRVVDENGRLLPLDPIE